MEDPVDDWDYIKLSNYPNRPRKSKPISKLANGNVVTFEKIPAGTCAQLISLNGAKKLLKNTPAFGRPIDVDLQYWWEKELHLFGLRPFPFQPTPEIASDITQVANRSDVKKYRLRRIWQQVKFKALKAWHSRNQNR